MPPDPDAIAHWESELAVALADHEDAELALLALKAQCDEACAVAQHSVALAPFEAQRFEEEAAHEPHREVLEATYARFGRVATAEYNLRRAHYGLAPRGSNPAAPGAVTEIAANIGADVGVSAQ